VLTDSGDGTDQECSAAARGIEDAGGQIAAVSGLVEGVVGQPVWCVVLA